MEYEINTEKKDFINEAKMKKIKIRVTQLEHSNFTLKRLKDSQIVDNIIKIIDAEVQNDN